MPFIALRVKKGDGAKSATWDIVNANDAMLAFGLAGGMTEGDHHGHVVMLYGVANDIPRNTDFEVGPFIMRGTPSYHIRFRTMESFPMIRAAIQTAEMDPIQNEIVNRAAAGGAFGPNGLGGAPLTLGRYNYDTSDDSPESILDVKVEHSVSVIDKFFIRHRMDLGGINAFWWIVGCDIEIV